MSEKSETHMNDRGFKKSGLNACQECPFRTSNLGRPHPDPVMYSQDEITRIWRSVTHDGSHQNCHMFDGDLHPWKDEWAASGYKKPVNIDGNRECAGILAMVKRELDAAVTFPSFDAYAEARPLGLKRGAFERLLKRRDGDGPEIRLSEYMTDDEVARPESFVDTSSIAWILDPTSLDRMLRAVQAIYRPARDCDCEYCERHGEFHEQADLTTAENEVVHVDQELLPLLTSMASQGIRTTESCVNFREVIEGIAPEQIPPLINGAPRSVLSHEEALRRSGSYIRLINESEPEKRFIARAGQIEGVSITHSSSITQIVFTANEIHELLEAIR